MKRNPSERFASAAEFRLAVERVERGATRGNPRRRALGFAAVAAVMVGALSLLGAGSGRIPGAQPDAVRVALAKVEPFFKMFRGAPVATPIAAPEPSAVAALPAPALSAAPAPEAAPEPEVAPPPAGSTVLAAAPAGDPGQVQLAAVALRAPEVIPMDPAALEALKDKARKAASKRRWKTTRKLAEEWTRADASAEPRLLLARSLKQSGLDTEANEILQELLGREPENQDAKALLGETKKKPKAAPTPAPRVKRPKHKTVTAKKR
jgi:hypothetical protein